MRKLFPLKARYRQLESACFWTAPFLFALAMILDSTIPSAGSKVGLVLAALCWIGALIYRKKHIRAIRVNEVGFHLVRSWDTEEIKWEDIQIIKPTGELHQPQSLRIYGVGQKIPLYTFEDSQELSKAFLDHKRTLQRHGHSYSLIRFPSVLNIVFYIMLALFAFLGIVSRQAIILVSIHLLVYFRFSSAVHLHVKGVTLGPERVTIPRLFRKDKHIPYDQITRITLGTSSGRETLSALGTQQELLFSYSSAANPDYPDFRDDLITQCPHAVVDGVVDPDKLILPRYDVPYNKIHELMKDQQHNSFSDQKGSEAFGTMVSNQEA